MAAPAAPPPGAPPPGTPRPPAPDVLRSLVVRGRRLRVSVREGDGTRPPLLLCNGIGASLELLDPFVDELGRLDPGRGVLRFDMPGVGGSPLPVVPYHMVTLPGLLDGLLDALGHPQVDVLGISWGGGLAQQYAARRRYRVRRLVLVATGTGSVMVPARPSVLAIMATPRRHQDPEYARRVAGEIYGGTMRTSPERAARLLHARTRRGPQRGYYYQLLAGAWWTTLPLLPGLRQPTLVLAGDDDPIIPIVNGHIMHRLLPHSRLHVYRGGHLALLTEADQLTPVVLDFLDSRDPVREAPRA